MDWTRRWKEIRTLGEGGQGKVFLVEDTRATKEAELISELQSKIENISSNIVSSNSKRREAAELFKTIRGIIKGELSEHFGALKVLHKRQDENEQSKAIERIKKEISAMSESSHANLLKILDSDPNSEWFVSEYMPEGTLDRHTDEYQGQLSKTLRAIRPLVEAVADLHTRDYVHRDIKPKNIFMSSGRGLVLGDFGLVFNMNGTDTRVTSTQENVGSWEWMPHWTHYVRVDDVRPTADVYSLGKVIWSMLSGQQYLHHWYYDDDRFNVEKLFSDSTEMIYANKLFAKCIVEREQNCLSNAGELLGEIDRTLSCLEGTADEIGDGIVRRCGVCGVGNYRLRIDRNLTELRNFGITPAGMQNFMVFSCSHCGHVQVFEFEDGKFPEAWK